MKNEVNTFTNFVFEKYLFSRLDYKFPVFYYQNGGLCKLSPDIILLLLCFTARSDTARCQSACYITERISTVTLSKKKMLVYVKCP